MLPASTRIARLIDTLRALERLDNERFSLTAAISRWHKSLQPKPKPRHAKLDILFVRQTRAVSTPEISSFE